MDVLLERYSCHPLGDHTTWLNYLGQAEAFADAPELYPRSQGMNVHDGERLIASIVWDPGYIRHLYVHPDYRGQGLLHLLLADYEGPAQADGDFVDPELQAAVQRLLAPNSAPASPVGVISGP